jgi:hypothetical protein
MPNSISEWFGHRVYPTVTETAEALNDQKTERCPFLSEALNSERKCIKSANSKGVCTVSSEADGVEMDWVVCPYRTLTSPILCESAERLFNLRSSECLLIPAPALAQDTIQAQVRTTLERQHRALVYFMDKLGGEIDIPGSRKSPKFKLDTTLVEIETKDGHPRIGKHAIVEVQTMDFHGSYRAATASLSNALKLHPTDFPRQLRSNPNWASAGIEGPNIANVFKRTIYQTLFKFQLAAHGECAGCVLAIPKSVWKSWQPHLGGPELERQPDGTFRVKGTPLRAGRGWILVFEVAADNERTPNPISITRAIQADADVLFDLTFKKAPAEAAEFLNLKDSVRGIIRRRIAAYWPALGV